jgi:RNA polymerase-binding transcription factor DksA
VVGKEDKMSPASKATAAKAPASRPPAAKKVVVAKKSAPAKVAPIAKKAAPAAKKVVPAKSVGKKVTVARSAAPVKKETTISKQAAPTAKKAAGTAKKAAPVTKAAGSTAKSAAAPVIPEAAPAPPAPPRTTFTPRPKPPAPVRPKTGPYVKDIKFLEEISELLLEERGIYQEQATSLRAEADSLALEREPGDVQFDEESGEGGTVTVDRERNLALSGQAALAVEEIDYATIRVEDKTYGYCERCFQPIPKPRLRALPYARLCVACKSGGLSRR